MKITKEEARGYSILKWEWIVRNNGKLDLPKLLNAFPKIGELLKSCGFCELYYNKNCKKCPLAPKNFTVDDCGCCQPDHPYKIWCFDDTVENAQKVLDLIKNS